MSDDFVQIPRSELQRLIDSLDEKVKLYTDSYKLTEDRLDIGRYTLAVSTHSILVDIIDKADKRSNN